MNNLGNSLRLISFAGLIAGCSLAQKVTSQPPELQAPKGSGEAKPKLVIKAESLPPEAKDIKTAPTLKAVPGAEAIAGTAEYALDKEETPEGAARRWSFKVTVKDFPENATQKRAAEFTWGDAIKAAKIEYTISSAPPTTATPTTWTVTPPVDPWTMTSVKPALRYCTSLIIATGDAGAENVQLAGSSIVEQSTKKPLGLDHLELCKVQSKGAPDPKDSCDGQTLPASRPTTLFLCVNESFHRLGNFKGNIYLAADKKPELTLVPVNIYSSSFWAKLFGVFLIVMGVFGSWFVLTFAKNRIARDQDLLPALLLRDRAAGLLHRIAALTRYPTQTDNSRNELLGTEGQLTDANLEANNFIHPADPSAFSQVTVDGPGYKTFVTNTSAALDALTVVVSKMEAAADRWNNTRTPAQQTMIANAINAIDNVRPAANTATAVSGATGPIIAGLDADLAGQPHPAAFAAPAPIPPPAPPSPFDRVTFDLRKTNRYVWTIAVILTSVTGYAVLIVPVPGFGVPMDFVYCLLWGFGLPMAGQQLSTGSVKTALFG